MTPTTLIVDDSKLARIVVGKALAALQPEWKRLEASNADEAKALIEQERVDLIILDYNMPGMNGLDLAEQLRGTHADMPIALATANIQDEIIARARKANIVFVAKPISEESLRGFVSGAAIRLRKPGP